MSTSRARAGHQSADILFDLDERDDGAEDDTDERVGDRGLRVDALEDVGDPPDAADDWIARQPKKRGRPRKVAA